MAEALTFFDCNARIGTPNVAGSVPFTSCEELIAQMDRGGITRALVHHVHAVQWHPREGNERLTEEIAPHPRLFPCFVGLPDTTDELGPADAFAASVRSELGAVRFFPREHGFRLSDWCMGLTLDALEAEAVPVLVDIGQIDWPELAELLAAHPALPVVLLDAYYRVDRLMYGLMERFDNLYLETTTYQPFEGIEAIAGRFGAERLLFGTNLPFLETGGPVAQITFSALDAEQRAAVAGGTLARLLGLTD